MTLSEPPDPNAPFKMHGRRLLDPRQRPDLLSDQASEVQVEASSLEFGDQHRVVSHGCRHPEAFAGIRRSTCCLSRKQQPKTAEERVERVRHLARRWRMNASSGRIVSGVLKSCE
jgi:hypothetical protein